MAEIGVVGRRDEAAVFGALGARTVFVQTQEEADAAVERLKKSGCALIFVSAQWRIPAGRDILPAVLQLPPRAGEDRAAEGLREAVRRAVGIAL